MKKSKYQSLETYLLDTDTWSPLCPFNGCTEINPSATLAEAIATTDNVENFIFPNNRERIMLKKNAALHKL